MKIESDIAFIKTCKREQVIPIFAKVKLHKKKQKQIALLFGLEQKTPVTYNSNSI